ncbi:MAG TPA: adenosylcobinamide-GDP ribazoletransferase [Nocardioidaceae bacterium]|nr:adenosylcobinamide-GDP ribazoletransferase [Nocardioidaceae bacterium]
MSIRLAIGFLTRIPVGRVADASLTASAAYFPLVGGLVGVIGLAFWWLGAVTLGPLAGAVVGVLATVVVTGALHEDGLADTADGLWGGATSKRRLAIMRDSRIGTYGVIAISGDLLLRIALLAPIDSDNVVTAARILVVGHVWGLVAPLVLAATLPPARTDGQGVRLGAPTAAGSAIAAVTVAAVTIGLVGQWAPIVMAAAAVALTGVWRLALRRIGGVTGDIHGAGVVVTNLAVAIVVAALAREGVTWVG